MSALLAAVAIVVTGCPRNEQHTAPTGQVICRLPWWYNLSSQHRGKIPGDWTHRELLEHLKGNGVEYVMFLHELPNKGGRGALFVKAGTESATNLQTAATGFFERHDPNVVYVQLRDPEQERFHMVGDGDFLSWSFMAGRFNFTGYQEQLMRIWRALPDGDRFPPWVRQ